MSDYKYQTVKFFPYEAIGKDVIKIEFDFGLKVNVENEEEQYRRAFSELYKLELFNFIMANNIKIQKIVEGKMK